MAYCRLGGGSDVYMYSHVLGGYQFHLSWDPVNGDRNFRVATAEEALRRLKRIKTQGYKVPDYAIERLEREIKESKGNET